MNEHPEITKLRAHVQKVAQLHEERRTLDERAFYPVHDHSKESSAYARVHHAMTITEDQPCRVCGVRASKLRSPWNLYGAQAMETHHHVIEWAHANAVDVTLFNEDVVRPLRARDPKRYARDFTRSEMVDWIDHDRDNLWVLCDVHHRHEWFGVHMISGPVWGVQRVLAAGVAAKIRKEIENDARRQTKR